MVVEAESTAADGQSRLAPPRLAVAYDITSSSPLELSQALKDACDLVWMVDTSDARLGSLARLLPRLGQVVESGNRSLDAVTAELSDANVDGVIAFTDSQLLLSSAVSHALGLPGNPISTVTALTDKVVQRRLLERAGVAVPRFRELAAGVAVDEAVARVEDVRFPAAVKPAHGSASRNVLRVSDPADLRRGLGEILDGAAVLPETYIAEAWLPEEAPGAHPGFASYVSVEAVVQCGEVVPLAITGKFPTVPPCRETGNFMPHHLGPDQAAAVFELAVTAAAALGVQAGALHIEIKLTPDGPRVIEVNGRIGGGGIDALYQARHGRSLTEIAAQVALGRRVTFDLDRGPQTAGPFVFEYFVQPPLSARRLTAMDHLPRVQALDGIEGTNVNRAVGDAIDWREGSQGYVLSVRGAAATLNELQQVPERIATSLALEFE